MTEIAKTALELATEAAEAKATETNAARTGKGLRVQIGYTRGRSPQVISYEAFDKSKPETCSANVDEFMTITGINDEVMLNMFLIDGYNDWAFTQASDPIAEHVEASWPEEVQKNFRAVVRQYASGTGSTIEEAVSMIKPAYLKAQAAK